MIKYSEKQKLSAIQTYISGELGLRATALLHNVGFTSLRNWISRYEALGIAGVQRKRRQAYDVEFKMKVLQTVKAEGLSHRQAGALFNIRRFSSIADWQRAYDKDGMGGLMPNHAAPRERNVVIHTPEPPLLSESSDIPSRQELLKELEYLRTENAFLKKLKALVQTQTTSAPGKGRKS